MATNHTSNYQLNQWEPTDQVLHTDFNEDNVKIDTALKSLDTTIKEQANAMAQFNTQLSKKGNCQLYFSTYTGDGAESRTYTFPGKPLFVQIYCYIEGYYYTLLNGATYAEHNNHAALVAWDGNSVTLTESGIYPSPNFNYRDKQYSLMALLQADA